MSTRFSLNGIAAGAAFAAVLVASVSLAAVNVDWVDVGHAGNAADGTGYGAVSYDYKIGKYEVSNNQYAAFLNAKGNVRADLYNTNMGSNINGGITRAGDGTVGNPYVFTAKPGQENHPANYVTWPSAVRFVNWLANGQGTGATETGSYTISGEELADYAAVKRNAGATLVLPTRDEWYKAAYYDPEKSGGAGYWDYATKSDSAPASVSPTNGASSLNAANMRTGGTPPVYAVAEGPFSTTATNLSAVDAYPLSLSAYGTFGQAGNVREFTDTRVLTTASNYALMGGGWATVSTNATAELLASGSVNVTSNAANNALGFRLALVPEPASLALLGLGAAGLLGRRANTRRA